MTAASDGDVRRIATRRWLVGLAIVVAGVGVLAAVLVVLPDWLAPRSTFGTAEAAVRAQNDVRGVVLQAVGGLVLVLGAYFTWRQLQVNRLALQHTLHTTAAQLDVVRRQLATSQETQVTERFTRAIDQLGSDQLVVRLGGVFALERIARDSQPDVAAVADVLSTYIREHSPLPANGSGRSEPAAHLQHRAADVQSALTVLAKGTVRGEDRLRLFGVDLRRANLTGARLAGADLEAADLAWAWLPGAQLAGADLTGANLRNAHLAGASLAGA